MYKNIILDFNGTLLDDCDVCLKILNILTNKYRIGNVSKERYMDVFTFPVSNYYKELGFDFSKTDFSIIGSQFHEMYNKISYDEASIFNSAIALLKYLKENNYYVVCISASMESTLIKQLKYYNIYEYFNEVIGLTDSLAISKLDVAVNWINNSSVNKDECLFIGDSIHDGEVATAMGVDCVLVCTGHTSKARLEKSDYKVIDDLLEIKKIL